MAKFLFFDTETNGLPPRYQESDPEQRIPKGYEMPAKSQPAIFQIGAMLYDGRTETDVLNTYVVPVDADGNVEMMPKTLNETTALLDKATRFRTTMTDEEVDRLAFLLPDEHKFNKLLFEGGHELDKIYQGADCRAALEQFSAMLSKADAAFAFNARFDVPVLRAAMQRHDLPTQALDDAIIVCPAETLTPYLKLPKPNKKHPGYKMPTLTEAYEKLHNDKPRVNSAHDALEDVRTLAEVVWRMEELNTQGVELEWSRYDFILEERAISNGYWPFGKHRGKKIADLEADYIDWILANFDTELLDDKSEYYNESLAIQLWDAREAKVK